MLNNPATTAVFIYFVFDFVLLMTARKFNTLILTKDANSNCNISKWIKSIVFLASNKKELNKSLNRNKLKWMVMQCPYNGRFFFSLFLLKPCFVLSHDIHCCYNHDVHFNYFIFSRRCMRWAPLRKMRSQATDKILDFGEK